MANQDLDFEFFLDNYEDLLSSYPNSFIVISDKNVKATGETFDKALNNALHLGLTPGEFIIQECNSNSNSFNQKFRSRVIF